MASAMLSDWMKGHQLQAPALQDAPSFYRNIEEKLDVRRANHSFWSDTWKDRDALDFSSNDTLSLGAGGALRAEFLQELSKHPTANFASGGARSLPDGRYAYLEEVEQEVAAFHGAEHGVIVGSGFEANVAIFTCIPQAGDIIVYDEMIHASVHDGMRKSRADKITFRHNSVESFREALVSALDQPLIRQKKRSVVIAVESLYSMEGDICPLQELVDTAKEILDNVYFVVDEAHSTGVIGPNGAGLVNALGLEREIAIRVHTCGKALAANGAIVLGNKTIRDALITLARPVFFSTAPSFPFVALIRSGYHLLMSGETRVGQHNVQHLVRLFFKTITPNVAFQKAAKMGILSIPLADGWEQRKFVTPIVPIWTRAGYHYKLFSHLALAKICAFAVQHPTVPKEHPRVRLVFHANHTESQVERVISVVCEWAQAMIDAEQSKTSTGMSASGWYPPTADRHARL